MLRDCNAPRCLGEFTKASYDDAVTQESLARAGVGRRLVAIGTDWLLAMIVSSALFTEAAYQQSEGLERILLAGQPFATLGIWAVQHLILVATIGTTIGHRLVGLRVVPEAGGGTVGFVSAAIRTVLLALVIPAVVWDSEGRGLHDRAAHTRIVSARA